MIMKTIMKLHKLKLKKLMQVKIKTKIVRSKTFTKYLCNLVRIV